MLTVLNETEYAIVETPLKTFIAPPNTKIFSKVAVVTKGTREEIEAEALRRGLRMPH